MRTAITLMAALIVLGTAGAAAATTSPTTADFTALLKASVKQTFKKKAPTLTLGTVTCTAPKSGKTYHCVAHFTDASAKAKIVYDITASLKKTTALSGGVSAGSIGWSASAPSCTSISTHAQIPC